MIVVLEFLGGLGLLGLTLEDVIKRGDFGWGYAFPLLMALILMWDAVTEATSVVRVTRKNVYTKSRSNVQTISADKITKVDISYLGFGHNRFIVSIVASPPETRSTVFSMPYSANIDTVLKAIVDAAYAANPSVTVGKNIRERCGDPPYGIFARRDTGLPGKAEL